MFNLTIRVMMGVGAIVASFLAGQHSASNKAIPSMDVVPALSTSVSHSSSTDNSATATTTDTQASRQVSLAKQIRLADTVALNSVGGGQVVSITPGQWNQSSVWTVRVAQAAQQWDVFVSQTTHDVLAKNLV